MSEFPHNKNNFSHPEIPVPDPTSAPKSSSSDQPKILPVRVFAALKRLFYPENTERASKKDMLSRIRDLTREGDQLCEKLGEIKTAFMLGEDIDKLAFIEMIIDPLIKEEKCLKCQLSQASSLMEYAKLFQNYKDWSDQTKQWLEYCSQVNDTSDFSDKVIEAFIEKSNYHIERDINMITEYWNHRLMSLSLSDDEKQHLMKKIQLEVDEHLSELGSLKKSPEVNEIKQIRKWKMDVDKNRSKVVDFALSKIDAFVEVGMKEVGNSTLSETEEVIFFRNKLVEIKDLLSSNNLTSKSLKNKALSLIHSLKKEIVRFQADVRLSDEIIEELDDMIDDLNEFSRLFDYT